MASEDKPQGLERRKGGRLYWVAPKKARALGFAPSTIRIISDDQNEIASLCAIYNAEAFEWIAQKEGASNAVLRDPTIAALFREYRERAESPFQDVKHNTRVTYSQMLDTIERAVGDVRLSSINLATLRRWYEEARYPEGKRRGAPEHVRKAHGIVSMLRRVMSFGVAAEIEGCERIATILANSRFEAPSRRTAAMTAEQAQTFVSAALEAGRVGLALGTALQFECAMRQKDVIGEWEPIGEEGPASNYTLNRRQWVNGLTWAHIGDDWRLTKRTTKTGAVVSHDLTLCPMALAILKAVPERDRIGPLIIDERTGRPFAENGYQEEWRKVANAAGLPRDLRNMDARAGALTEGDEAGAALEDLRQAAGHSDAKMTARYVRGAGLEQSRRVAELRLAHRRGK